MAMALVLLHALLLASASSAAPMGNATGDGSSNATTTSQVMCSGAECEPPGKPLPIHGYPPPAAPSLPPAPPSAPGSQTPCPPVAVVCCGGSGGQQYMPPQSNNYGPPTGGYVPYYNASASPPALLAPDVALVGYQVMVACVFIMWLVV
ncbi:unnamed protein product [Urochloa humidicola]